MCNPIPRYIHNYKVASPLSHGWPTCELNFTNARSGTEGTSRQVTLGTSRQGLPRWRNFSHNTSRPSQLPRSSCSAAATATECRAPPSPTTALDKSRTPTPPCGPHRAALPDPCLPVYRGCASYDEAGPGNCHECMGNLQHPQDAIAVHTSVWCPSVLNLPLDRLQILRASAPSLESHRAWLPPLCHYIQTLPNWYLRCMKLLQGRGFST